MSSGSFEITVKDAMGRIGKLQTPHGVVETPAVMPVINSRLNTVPSSEMRKYGAEMLMTNSYIIYRDEEMKGKALSGGVHNLLGWDGALMTDSGSYQLSVYGGIEVTNSEIVEFQEKIGSDIAVALDIPTPPYAEYGRAKSDLEETIIRLKEARDQTDMMLAGTVQGSTHPDLREFSARETARIGFELYPIGAVVPLMESYRYRDLVDVIVASKKALPPCSPVHLFGAGHPMLLPLAVMLGCDLFDSAAYALYARDNRYITADGTYHLKNLKYLPCSCPVCLSYTPEELMQSEGRLKLLSEHNLYVTFEEVRRIKQAIREGNLVELVERRCTSHPSLVEGFRRAVDNRGIIEAYDPISKGTFFYSSPLSAMRPEVERYHGRLGRMQLSGKVLVATRKSHIKGWRGEYDHVMLVRPPFGPYPLELKETYPIGQSEVPYTVDNEGITSALNGVLRLVTIEANTNVEFTFKYDGRFDGHPLIEEIRCHVRNIESA